MYKKQKKLNEEKKMIAKRLFMFVVTTVFVLMSSICYAGDLSGTGDNFGSGWRKDSSGNIHGTGDNFGRGGERNNLMFS
jgi:hypothetical protein